ncbi:MAG: hypothetical protein Ta2F_16800 [Termitinemataceae bacterium]|nr:MAG: hypothetical protein Ta2F_16800 [Termitinemataceae bacterium]
MRLANKKALVTGASRGIGMAIANRFLEEGASVWGIGTREPAWVLDAPKKECGQLHWINADLGDLASVEALIEGLIKEAGGFDVLVNNAGITRDNLAFRMTLEDFQKVLDVNLSATFLIARTIGRYMIRERKGSIINMASVVGIHGKKINAYIFNNVLFPKFKKSVCWEALFIDSLLFNSF